MKEKYEFMESALRAGYPYVMVSEAQLDGKVDAVIYSSYKTIKAAYKDAARQIARIADVYGATDDLIVFNAAVFKTSFFLEKFPQHDLICMLSRYNSGHLWLTRGEDLKQEKVRVKESWR